jgi:hypothetical protein
MADSEAEPLQRLQTWYVSNVDGDWEHSQGVELGTLDNPGWQLNINLVDTSLEGEPFEELKVDRTEHDWIRCWVSDVKFHARCGPENLVEAVDAFLDWASAHPPKLSEQLFTNGQAVLISGRPSWEHSGESATISGVRHVDNVAEAVRFRCRIGTVLYLIAFGDGSTSEVFADALEPLPSA